MKLADEHPELFQRAIEYEDKVKFEAQASGRQFTWSQGESLRELIARREEIVAQHEEAMSRERQARPNRPLSDVLSGVLDDEDDALACTMCHV